MMMITTKIIIIWIFINLKDLFLQQYMHLALHRYLI